MGGGALSNLFKKILGSAGDDIAAKVSSQYGDDVIRNLATSSADDIAQKSGNLIATHQLTADKLKGAADLGGFVQPSMAVVDPSKGTNFLPGSDFGDIVMVANRNTIDPKATGLKNIIGDRDIYSPRFPKTQYQMNAGALDDILAQNPGISKASALSNMNLDDEAVYDSFIKDVYLKNNPQASNLSSMDLRKSPDFMQYADDMQGKLRGENMFAYDTPSGNTKTLPMTAENANTIMNKSGAIGTERMMSRSPGLEFYQSGTKKIKSLDDLYKNRYRLVDNVTGEATKDALNEAAMSPAYTLGRLDDRFSDALFPTEEAAKYLSGNKNIDLSQLEAGTADSIAQQVSDLKAAYSQVPTSYFEAKPRRVVGGNEFYGAYVPESAPQEVIDQLNQLGVNNINRYTDAGDLDLSLAQLAGKGKRGISPYVLGLGGLIPTGGVLGAMLGGGNDQQPMV